MKQQTAAQSIRNQLKSSSESKMIEELKRKPVHGEFNQDLERPSGDKGKSLAWLCRSALKAEMENLIIAAQDQAPSTCYHQRNIMKQPVESKCRPKNTQNILLQDAQHLHPLNTLMDTIRWLITSTE